MGNPLGASSVDLEVLRARISERYRDVATNPDLGFTVFARKP